MKKVFLILGIILVVLAASSLRLLAVEKLGIDYDEDDYLFDAQSYASAIRQGDLEAVINFYHDVHPPLGKLVYALALIPFTDSEPIPEPSLDAGIAAHLPELDLKITRIVAASLGTLQVLFLAFFNPLAAFFLGINSWQVKYTSQVMLESLPSLTSLVVVLCYLKSKRKWNGWLFFSAVFFGLTMSAKYTYFVVGLTIMVDWLISTYPKGIKLDLKGVLHWFSPAAIWMVITTTIFFMTNPYLWTETLPRLINSVTFHGGYATGEQVQTAGLPIWSPLIYLFGPTPWHPEITLLPIERLVTIFAILGLRRTWQRQRIFVIWLIIGFSSLILWPTKWPQYILIITVPVTVAAAEGFQQVVLEPLITRLGKLKSTGLKRPRFSFFKQNRPDNRAIFWILPGAIVLGLIVVYPMILQLGMAITDFTATAIRDGLNGGVWREVWNGITGKTAALPLGQIFQTSSKQVHYIGAIPFIGFLLAGATDPLVFGVIWMILAISLQTILGISVALLLNRPGLKIKRVWTVIFILPWAIPELVGALMWSQVFDPRFGWANLAAKTWYERADYPGALNLTVRWQEEPNYALVILLITAIWYGFPFMMLVASASLKLLPRELFDAAAIDGANSWNSLRLVTIPLLFPLMVPAILIRAIFAFNQFYIFYVMRPPPSLATLSFSSFNVFSGGAYAISAWVNLLTVLVLIILIARYNKISRASEGFTYA